MVISATLDIVRMVLVQRVMNSPFICAIKVTYALLMVVPTPFARIARKVLSIYSAMPVWNKNLTLLERVFYSQPWHVRM
jgi:hypothetical protein